MTERILVIKLSALGDIVQAEGAMHDIRLAHPDSEITVLTTPGYRKLMARCPWVDAILIDPRDSRFRLDRMLALRKTLRSHRFSLVYDLQQVGRTHFYFRWFLRDTDWLGGVRGCRHYCPRPDDRCAADHFRISLENAGIPAVHTLASDVGWMAEDMTDFLGERGLEPGFIVLFPGCSARHPEKRWPHYGELARLLLADGCRLVTIPGPDELELCRALPGEMLLHGDGRWLDYFELAGVVRQASFVVGNDTGPTHIAAHLRRPGLALFGGHHSPCYTGIQHSRFVWLERADIADIGVDEVLESVLRGL